MSEITHRRVLKIALPIVLSNVTVPILGAVDTGVVGQLGQAAPIGAVGLGAIILVAFYWIFGFLRMGTTGLVAQAKGADDIAETGAILTRALLIGAVAGIGLILVQIVIFSLAFVLAPASAEVEALTWDYLSIRIWGAPATIALYAITGWLIAVERTFGVLLLQFWMNGLNILLDLWFVLGLGWGVEGVAIATLIAEWTGLLLGLWLCRDAFSGRQWCNWARIFDRVKIAHMMKVNTDIMIRSVALQASLVVFLFLGAYLGDVTLAANQVLLQFLHITGFALDGFAFAAEVMVGGAVGAGMRADLRRASAIAFQWGIVGAIALGAGFWLGGQFFINWMATSPEVQLEAGRYLFWVSVAPILGVFAWMLDGIYIGATWTRAMRQAMLESVAIYILALCVLVPIYGNAGLWAALMILNVIRAFTLAIRYPRLESSILK